MLAAPPAEDALLGARDPPNTLDDGEKLRALRCSASLAVNSVVDHERPPVVRLLAHRASYTSCCVRSSILRTCAVDEYDREVVARVVPSVLAQLEVLAAEHIGTCVDEAACIVFVGQIVAEPKLTFYDALAVLSVAHIGNLVVVDSGKRGASVKGGASAFYSRRSDQGLLEPDIG